MTLFIIAQPSCFDDQFAVFKSRFLSAQYRTVTVRQPDGTLRFATPEEKDRILFSYFPRPGRMPQMPAMFEESRLEVNLLQLLLGLDKRK